MDGPGREAWCEGVELSKGCRSEKGQELNLDDLRL